MLGSISKGYRNNFLVFCSIFTALVKLISQGLPAWGMRELKDKLKAKLLPMATVFETTTPKDRILEYLQFGHEFVVDQIRGRMTAVAERGAFMVLQKLEPAESCAKRRKLQGKGRDTLRRQVIHAALGLSPFL